MNGEGPYLTAEEAAEYLRISVPVLKRLKLGIQVSPRRTVYRRADLDKYVESQRPVNQPGLSGGGA